MKNEDEIIIKLKRYLNINNFLIPIKAFLKFKFHDK